MSYEPRGKMVDLIAAFRLEPQRVFSMKEVSAILGCKSFRSTVDQYLYAAIADGCAFKRENDGAMYYSGQAVSDELLKRAGIEVKARNNGGMMPSPNYTDEERERAQTDVRAPGASGFVPPRMPVPRSGSDVPCIVVKPPPAPAAPPPAPALVDASIPEGAGAEVDEVPEEEAEAVEFDACLWLDGSMTIWGAQDNVDGSITIHPDQLLQLRKRMAWGHIQ